ncbi:MAG TPA: peptidoglycan-binding domain-containing protein [Rhizobiaceae bacterium]|nr:peptidoglycan-binding domain-containing protein [Rhizobiaceae bacterium]
MRLVLKIAAGVALGLFVATVLATGLTLYGMRSLSNELSSTFEQIAEELAASEPATVDEEFRKPTTRSAIAEGSRANVDTPMIALAKPVENESADNLYRRTLAAQAGLRAFGDVTVPLDGVTGFATRAALREYQMLFALPPTGEPDTATLASMREMGLVDIR